MTTSTSSKQTGLQIITSVNPTSSQTNIHHHQASGLMSAVDEYRGNALLNRYSFSTKHNPSDNHSSHNDDSDSYPQGVGEEIEVYLQDKNGNFYVEKAVVRRRSSKVNMGDDKSANTTKMEQKVLKSLEAHEDSPLSAVWSPLDIRCRGMAQNTCTTPSRS